MKAYKGFDKDLKCRGFQYEVGKEYEEGSAELCEKGFHACENRLDALGYYGRTDSRYCEVDVDDNGERNSDDSKVCGKHIKIGAEIGLKGVINAGGRFVFDKCESATEENASGERGNAAASGFRGNAAASGVSGNAAASGERGNAAASGTMGNAAASGVSGTAAVTGRYGKASAIGKQCVAVAWGQDSLARGSVGNWLVVSERDDAGNIIDAKIVRVDGEAVKENTWYTLQNGEISEVEE